MADIPNIALIAAVSENGTIGKDNNLPWKISADLKRFKKLTTTHPIIMGRKTFESIGRVLPERKNIIVTRDPNYRVDGGIVTHSLTQALEEARKEEKEEIFIIGGGEIYKEAIPLTDILYLTLVHAAVSGDTFFPDYSEFKNVVYSEEGSEGEWRYTFFKLTR